MNERINKKQILSSNNLLTLNNVISKFKMIVLNSSF